MRIVSWNCARGPLVKKLRALESLKPDVAILCEAPPPALENEQVLWFPSGVSTLGVQVRAYGGYTLERLPVADLPRCVNPARVVGELSFNLLATWTWPAPSYVKAFTNALDAYADLIASGPVVIAGDLNGNPRHDKPRQWVRWGDVFARLKQFGLVSAYHQSKAVGYGEEPDPTHLYLRNPERPFHIDYCFVPSAWVADSLTARVEAGQPWNHLSDHYPVVVELGRG